MKKITAILSAAVLLAGACSCSDKPDVSEPDGDVTTAPVTETETEPPYAELTEADFAPVDIKCAVTDTEPPIEVNSADLSSIDFGARMSPCKAPDVRESYKNSMMRRGNEERFDEAVAKLVETPCKGAVTSATFGGGKFYLTVNYDDFCNLHDSSLYCYDVETGECKELAAHSGLEYNGYFSGLTFAHDKLYYIEELLTDSDEGTKTALYCLDPESGDISELCTVDGYIHGLHEIENGLFMYRYIDFNNGIDYLQYDIGTNELSPYTFPEAEGEGPKDVVLCDGVPAEVTGGFDGEKYNPITVKTQYYTLSTEVTKYTKIFLWRDKVCIVANNDYSHDWLYTYDLTRRERLKMKFDGYSNSVMIQTEEGIFMMVGTGSDEFGQYKSGYRLCLLTPVQGTVYRLALFENCLCGNIGDTVYYLTLTSTEEPFEDYALVNRNTGNGLPDKLYWFKSAGGTIPRSGYGVYFEW